MQNPLPEHDRESVRHEHGDADGSRTSASALPWHRVLLGLFLDPRILFLLQHGRCGRAFRLMAAVSLCAGAAIGLSKAPAITDAAADWGKWLSREVGELRLNDGEIEWRRPQNLPYTTRYRGLRIEFAGRGAAFPATRGAGPERQGVWLSPVSVYYWRELPGGGSSVVRILHDKKAWGAFEVDKLWPDGLHLCGSEIEQRARSLARRAIPFVLLREAVALFVPAFFYAFIFALVPGVFRVSRSSARTGAPRRRGIVSEGFRGAFTFYLYASVPPLIIAAVYASLQLPHLNAVHVFVCGFVGYLLFAARALRLRPADAPGGE